MLEIKKSLTLQKLDYYETHLSIINCLFPKDLRMFPMEIKVLATFMSLEGEKYMYKFGPSGKAKVMEILGLSPSGLSNYFKALTLKGFLKKTGDITHILDILVPEDDVQFYRFRLVIDKVKLLGNGETNMLM